MTPKCLSRFCASPNLGYLGNDIIYDYDMAFSGVPSDDIIKFVGITADDVTIASDDDGTLLSGDWGSVLVYGVPQIGPADLLFA